MYQQQYTQNYQQNYSTQQQYLQQYPQQYQQYYNAQQHAQQYPLQQYQQAYNAQQYPQNYQMYQQQYVPQGYKCNTGAQQQYTQNHNAQYATYNAYPSYQTTSQSIDVYVAERMQGKGHASCQNQAQNQSEQFTQQQKQKTKQKQIHTLFGTVLNIQLSIMIVFIILLVVPRLVGIAPNLVTSGSMEPNIPVASIAYVNMNVAKDSLKPGDVACYKIGEDTQVLHRVKEIRDGEYVFQGDANKTEDAKPVTKDNIIGAYIFHIPLVGRAYAYAVNNFFLVITVIIGLNLVIYILSEILRERRLRQSIGTKEITKQRSQQSAKLGSFLDARKGAQGTPQCRFDRSERQRAEWRNLQQGQYILSTT